MILRYGGSNFFCFKEEFEIDLRLNKNCPSEISADLDCSKVMCIKGANAAGKTNALKALSFLASFISSSFNEKPDFKLSLETYFGNNKASNLFCEFRINKLDYRYELSIEKNEVVKEDLYSLTNEQPLFRREKNSLKIETDTYFELSKIPSLRSNASIISTANQHEMECISEIYNFFFYGQYSNVGDLGFDEILDNDSLSKFYNDHPKILDFVIEQLNKYDTGIKDITIDSYFDKEGNEIFFPLFYFDVEGTPKILRLHHQSSGTKRLYKLLGWCYLMTDVSELKPFASIMVMDELDLHLHSDILPELIKLFQDKENTQLIFTCQNDRILDTMGKYRTIFINKDANESYSYRLDELPSDLLRNHRPITPHYKKGSIGGVPNIGK
jgi:hypothetical protein